MNRFNLTFSGEILPGEEPDEVRRRFGQFFAITDPARLDKFFSGETITLRRNLERKAAAECFQEMRRVGVVAELVKVSASEAADAVVGAPVADGGEVETHFARPRSASAARQTPDARAAEQRRRAEREREQAERERETAEREREAAEREREAAERERETAEREQAEKARREQARAERRAAARRDAEEKRAKKAAARAEAAQRAAAEREREREAREREQARREREQAERERIQAERERIQAERERKQAEREREKAEREQRKAEAAAEAAAAAKEEKQRRRAETAARTEQERRRKREQREQKRRELAARKAGREAARRRAAEEAARQRIFEEERRRETETARREAEAEERRARETEQARQAAARREAEARERAEAQAREQALAEQRDEEDRQRELLDAQALERAGRELTRGSAVRPVKARVKTRLGVAGAKAGEGGDQHAGRRRRQPGEPNLFALTPFRNTATVRERPERAERALRRWAAVGALALVALFGLIAVSRSVPEPATVAGASGLAPLADGGLAMLAGGKLLLHDRAGNPLGALGIDALGLASLSPPLALAADGDLYAVGSRPAAPRVAQLLRCQLDTPGCAPIEAVAEAGQPVALAPLDIDGSLLLATPGQLLRLDSAGALQAQADTLLPETLSMVPHTGLLFLNSAAGPAVRVLRYDASAFAQQLDEILLLPPGIDPATASVNDLALLDGQWWAVISTGEDHHASLHRFDGDWNHLGEVTPLPPGRSLRLMPWSGRMLVNTGVDGEIARYSAAGRQEAPLASSLLAAEITASQRRIALQAGAWRLGFLLLALVIVTAVAVAYLYHLRRLVYRLRPAQGAAPVEDRSDTLVWIEPDRDRRKSVRGLAFSYAVLCFALCLLAIGQGASAAGLTALFIVLSGPAAGLLLVSRHPVGHIGVDADRLLLVDHAGTYHFGSGAAIQYRGAFLLMDDVAVFTGNGLLPAFPRKALARHVAPLVRGGVRVDRRTVAIKLLQARHPLALGALLSAAACAAGVLFLLSIRLF